MDEPRFAQPIPNVSNELSAGACEPSLIVNLFYFLYLFLLYQVTVAVGRDANLPCVVEHLGAYKVNIVAHCIALQSFHPTTSENKRKITTFNEQK